MSYDRFALPAAPGISRCLLGCLSLLLSAAPSWAQQVTPGCTTSTTCTTQTSCTGDAAALALTPPVLQVQPPALAAAPAPVAAPDALPTCPEAAPPAYPTAPAYPAAPAQPWLPRYQLVEKEERDAGLLITGGSMFAATWLPMAAVAFMTGEGRMAIPVAGPMLLAHDIAVPQLQALLIVEGLTQATAIGLFVGGLATTHKTQERQLVTVAPTFSSTGAGLAAMGRF